ncbi:hypothetical protein MESS4_340016 [Mesorhizobium sp. STM 4661]|nr:hypothetical protein MESS4_340016 [Mesorhizobium sp. STM 4661]
MSPAQGRSLGGGRRRQSCSERSAGPVAVTLRANISRLNAIPFLLSLSLYLSRALSDCVNPPAVSADGTVRDPPVRGAAEQLNQVSHQAGCAATSSQLTLVPRICASDELRGRTRGFNQCLNMQGAWLSLATTAACRNIGQLGALVGSRVRSTQASAA